MGRFINADAFTSTGQGLLGNNMFAYCNNNPVCFIDPYGYRPGWGLEYKRLDDGGSCVCNTDGSAGSEELSQYILDYIVPSKSSAVSVSVYCNDAEYYYENTWSRIGDVASKAGLFILVCGNSFARILASIPNTAPFAGLVQVAADTLGGLATVIGGIVAYADDYSFLPNGNYAQYTANVSWTTVTNPVGFPSVKIYTTYSVNMVYVWNNIYDSNYPYWCLLDYTYETNTRTYY